MHYSISEIIVLFFTYSVVGWLWETFYCSIKDHHYAYRGFLFGPYCPVYGFAVTTILITAEPVKNNLILLFIVGFIVASIFEYFASLFLEKVFHMTERKHPGKSFSRNIIVLGDRCGFLS